MCQKPTKTPLESIWDFPIYAFSRARSYYYELQATLAEPLSRRKELTQEFSAEEIQALEDALQELIRADSVNIRKGLYPLNVLRPEPLFTHLGRFPKLLLEGLFMANRRARGKTQDFNEHAKHLLEDVPQYYRRNFHFQSNGYLSEESAELYEHQVEILFSGTGDPMRRLIIPPMKEHFKNNPKGKGLRFLEIAAGTGRATRFVHQAFPEAKITVTDLSYPYLKKAQERLRGFQRLDFVQAAGENLPFTDEHFDAVYSVFLFHELPLETRKTVIQDSRRVLKRNGFWGMVDALQTNDNKTADRLLGNFNKNFQEPFFRDYLSHPVEGLIRYFFPQSKVEAHLGFLSKVVHTKK